MGPLASGALVTHHKDIQSPLTERLIEIGGSASVGVQPTGEVDSIICLGLPLYQASGTREATQLQVIGGRVSFKV